jgi:hypothetical protein
MGVVAAEHVCICVHMVHQTKHCISNLVRSLRSTQLPPKILLYHQSWYVLVCLRVL